MAAEAISVPLSLRKVHQSLSTSTSAGALPPGVGCGAAALGLADDEGQLKMIFSAVIGKAGK